MKIIILSFTSFILSATWIEGQSFQNLNFDDLCEASSTKLCHWDRSWGNEVALGAFCQKSGNYSLLIDIVDNVGFAEQSSKVTGDSTLKIITLSGNIKSEKVEGKGAGLNIGVYNSIGTLLFTKDMGYASFNWASGTTEWKVYTISAVCPPEGSMIKIGAILYGTGKAWFDDFMVNVVSADARKPSKFAEQYISAATDSIKLHSLRRDSINIDSLKNIALQIAGAAKNYGECYLAVTYLLQSLGDHHSFFMEPEEVRDWEGDNDKQEADIKFANHALIDSCGYISVPYFHGGNPKLILAYADTLQAALRKLDSSSLKGWIIDLRENTGGNMEPMVAGLGPLFDAERLGTLVDVNGEKESWGYEDGTYYWENEIRVTVSEHVVLSKQLPIAVIIGPQTGSSGEIVAISFIGNGNTKTFGQPTWGLTTGNGAFDLPDGARMMLASTIMADRNGKLYYGQIEPDEKVEKGSDSQEDFEIQSAVEWLLSQNR